MFVGRRTLLSAIRTSISGDQRECELWGALGSGKTSVLLRLKAIQDGQDPIEPCILENMEHFNPGHRGESGDQASVGAVQGSFFHFKELLTTLIEQSCSEAAALTFQRDVTAAFNSEVALARIGTINRALAVIGGDLEADRRPFSLKVAREETRGDLAPKDLADAWRNAATAVSESFVSHWNASRKDEKRMLLLLDNVDEIADQEIGVWVGLLLSRLEGTTVVLTRRGDEAGAVGDGAPSGWPTAVRGEGVASERMRPFSEEEVSAYLKEKGVTDPDVGRVVKISSGHPGTVAIVYDLLWGTDVRGGANRTDALRDLPDQKGERVAALVESLVDRWDDEMMKLALWASVVPRRFDVPLLRSLLADSDSSSPTEDEVRPLFDGLEMLPFLEAVPGEKDVLRMHSYVRNDLLDRMSRTPKKFKTLNQQAAKYHYEMVVKEEEVNEGAGAYGDAFIFENPDWQRSKQEWLYHRGMATDPSEKQEALLEFARIFLETFWWWGNYVHFDFCDQLLADLGQLVLRHDTRMDASLRAGSSKRAGGSDWPELEALYEALRCILREYPPRSGKTKNAEWGEVQNALRKVKRVCALQEDPKKKPRSLEQRLVESLVDVFLAHAYRYQAGEQPLADEYYAKAAAGFEEVGKQWSLAWVAFEQADLRFERRGDNSIEADDKLQDLWLQAATIVQRETEFDEELASNLYRLRGDCCLEIGDLDRAAQWYGQAVLHAYLFHFVGGPPDEYTLQFYVDIRARMLNRMFDLWSDDKQEEMLNLSQGMACVLRDAFEEPQPAQPPGRETLHQLVADRQAVKLADTLFPRGPEYTELLETDSLFADEFEENREAALRHGDRIDVDLNSMSWP